MELPYRCSSSPTYGCQPKGLKEGLKEILVQYIYSSPVHNSQGVKTTQCLWVDKCTYTMWSSRVMEYHAAVKKEGHLDICSNVDAP
jgi:hypothetical protein